MADRPHTWSRPLTAAALLLASLNLHAQVQGAVLDGFGARTLLARLVLCYVAAYWLRFSWKGLTTLLSGPPTPPPAPPGAPRPARAAP